MPGQILWCTELNLKRLNRLEIITNFSLLKFEVISYSSSWCTRHRGLLLAVGGWWPSYD